MLLAVLAGLVACSPEAEKGPAPAPSTTTAAAPSATEAPTVGRALAHGAAAGRDLILVTLDTTRADRLGCYGFTDATGASPTPVLDALARQGVRFADAVSPVPMTAPAHTSLLTGLDPPHHGVRANGQDRLDPATTTLAELLAGAGYDTAAFVSSFVLDPRFGLDQGFAVYDATLPVTRQGAVGSQNERSAEAVTDAALAWLAARSTKAGGQASANAPFFLWVHYFDAHDPYTPPEPFASRYADDLYEGEIAAVDRQVGRLLDAVKTAGAGREMDRSVVVVAGDHGESLGEHGERFHSRTLYEGAVHVPLLVAAPGLPGLLAPGVDAGEVVGLVDVVPTVLDLLGLDTPAGLDGRSLLRSLADPGAASDPDRALYLETLNTYLDTGWAPLYALRRHDGKYIEAPRPEYYDLVRDPHEQHDLLAGDSRGTPPPAARRLAGDLRGRLAEQPGIVEVANGLGSGAADPEVRRRLESLGYLSGGGSRPASATDLPDPKDMLPLHEQLLAARAAMAAGDPARAVRLARTLIHAAPRNRAALQLLGEAYATMGDLDRAEQALRRHLEVGPSVAAEVLLAQVVMQKGRLDEAEALLDAAAALDPDHGAVPLARGDLFLVEGRPADARASYERAGRIDPTRFGGLAAARIERLERLLAEHGAPGGRASGRNSPGGG